MEAETEDYIQRMITLKEQLHEQATELELIEQEKDKKQRKLKQKEYVLITHTTHIIYTCMCISIYVICYEIWAYTRGICYI